VRFETSSLEGGMRRVTNEFLIDKFKNHFYL
jgi:hypothetical protein